MFKLRDIAMGLKKTYKTRSYADFDNNQSFGDLDPISIVG